MTEFSPLKTALMTPSSNTKGISFFTDTLQLKEIPGAMRKMGWDVAAQLMDQWFSNPLYIMPEESRTGKDVNYLALPPDQVNDNIVTMDWLLSFERIKPVYDNLLANWASPAGKKELFRKLEKKGWRPEGAMSLGEGLYTAMELDLSSQVNSSPFGWEMDTLDGLYGAIFKANLKIAVVGEAMHNVNSEEILFEVKKLGIYMRDTYDFNADWIEDTVLGLGVWSRDRVLGKDETVLYHASRSHHWTRWLTYRGFVPVKNADFRAWQEKNKRGGDFFVFSDVKWVDPNEKFIKVPILPPKQK